MALSTVRRSSLLELRGWCVVCCGWAVCLLCPMITVYNKGGLWNCGIGRHRPMFNRGCCVCETYSRKVSLSIEIPNVIRNSLTAGVSVKRNSISDNIDTSAYHHNIQIRISNFKISISGQNVPMYNKA